MAERRRLAVAKATQRRRLGAFMECAVIEGEHLAALIAR